MTYDSTKAWNVTDPYLDNNTHAEVRTILLVTVVVVFIGLMICYRPRG